MVMHAGGGKLGTVRELLVVNLTRLVLQVAKKVGVDEDFIAQRIRGAGSRDVAAMERHSRFAAACAVNSLLSEQTSSAAEQVWGEPFRLSPAGLGHTAVCPAASTYGVCSCCSPVSQGAVRWW